MAHGFPPALSSLVTQAALNPRLRLFIVEGCKGSELNLSSEFCPLVPPFTPFNLRDDHEPPPQQEVIHQQEEMAFIRLAFPKGDAKYEWFKPNIMPMLAALQKTVLATIYGNNRRLYYELRVPKAAVEIITTNINANFPWVHLSVHEDNRFLTACSFLVGRGAEIFLEEFRRPAPYHHPAGFSTFSAPLPPILETLHRIPQFSIGFIQVIFQGTTDDWSGNILSLHAAETRMANYCVELPWRVAKNPWEPSAIIATSVRVGAIGSYQSIHTLESLASSAAGYLSYGSTPCCVHSYKFRDFFDKAHLLSMIAEGRVCLPGMLLCPEDICRLFHFPSEHAIATYPIERVEPLDVPQALRKGSIHLGNQKRGDEDIAVYQPAELEFVHDALIGNTGAGKSELQTHLALQYAERGTGICFIDPHRVNVENMAKRLSQEAAERAVLIDFGHPDFAPALNLFECPPGGDINALTDTYMGIIKAFHSARDFGAVQELLVEQTIRATLSVPGMTIIEAGGLWEKSSDGSALRTLAKRHAPSERDRKFWQSKYKRYSTSESERALTKIPFLTDNRLARGFSAESKININQMMEEGKILLVPADSGQGTRLARMIASLFSALVFAVALKRKPDAHGFLIVIDELQYFSEENAESMLRELRKFRVGLLISLQSISQLKSKSAEDAIASVGTLIAFDLTYDQAQKLHKRFAGLLEPSDLMRKGVGKAHAIIGEHLTSFTTPEPPELTSDGYFEEIKQRSFEQYYVPVEKPFTNMVRRPRGFPPISKGK